MHIFESFESPMTFDSWFHTFFVDANFKRTIWVPFGTMIIDDRN